MRNFTHPILFLFAFSLLSLDTPKGIVATQKKASSGNVYTVLPLGNNNLQFTLKRPDKKDPNTLLCIAAAFTRLDNGKVDGACAVEGKIIHTKVNHHLGGAIWIDKTGVEIYPWGPAAGDKMEDGTQAEIKGNKASFFQQIQIIVNGKAEKFKDVQLFQRRAIVIFADKSMAIAESKEAITLASFSNDLVELGAYNALYTDMGAWDEGWYRDAAGKIISMGTSKSQTAKQSNWVVFSK